MTTGLSIPRLVLFAGLTLIVCTARADHPGLDFGAATAGPIRTVASATLPKGAVAAGVQIEYARTRQFTDDQLKGFAANDVAAHSLDAVATTALGLSYGVTDDLTLGLRLPYVRRTNIREGESATEVHAHGDSAGAGDLTVLAKFRTLKDLEGDGTALLLGIKAPTGNTDRNDLNGKRLETELQPGSGSWDAIVGAAATTRLGSAGLHASVLYSIAGMGARQTRLGNRAQYGVALAWRLGGETHSHESGAVEAHPHNAWDLMLELNGEWEGRQHIAEVPDPNSGGRRMYLSPGVRFVSESGWAAYASLGIPFAQGPNGAQTQVRGRLIAGFAIGF